MHPEVRCWESAEKRKKKPTWSNYGGSEIPGKRTVVGNGNKRHQAHVFK